MIKAVAGSGAKLAAENYSPGAFFSKLERGVYWLDPSKRGEGLNLVDFAAQKYVSVRPIAWAAQRAGPPRPVGSVAAEVEVRGQNGGRSMGYQLAPLHSGLLADGRLANGPARVR